MKPSELGQQEHHDFLSAWPIERLQTMNLDQYTNLDKDTAFIYWLEKKTERTGSIWGGSAFKFGIYRRRSTEFVEQKKFKTDGIYAWLSKYGDTKEEAFTRVKGIILDIVACSTSNDLQAIDDIDLGDAVKWKIAYLYNPNDIVPIYNRQMLQRAAESFGLKGWDGDSVSALHRFLLSVKPAEQSTLEFAQTLWGKFNLDNFYAPLEKFINQAQTNNLKKQGYPTTFRDLDVKVGFGAGEPTLIPWVAFLKDPNTVTEGIYPVYLYYKSENIVILAYGRSEAHEPQTDWPNAHNLTTIEAWFEQNKNSRPRRYGRSYVKAVYDLSEALNPEKVQADLDGILTTYKTIPFATSQQSMVSESEPEPKQRVWLISPGDGAEMWEPFYKDGVVGIGWNFLGDLRKYSSKEEIRKHLLEDSTATNSQSHTALCLWQFSREMKEDDIIIAKKGTSEYLGYGIVKGPYYFDETRTDYKHLLSVEWKKKGVWEESAGPIVTKILTDITKYPEYVDRLKRVIGIEQDATVDPSKIEYYWLNANPKYWRIEDYQVGQEQSYTTHNEKGNKRSRFEYFQKIKPGDLILGYETTPIQKVVAIFEVTQGTHLDEDTGQEEISFKIQKFLPNPVSLETLKSMSQLKNAEVMRNNQGSLFRLSKEEFTAIVDLDVKKVVELPLYTLENAEKEIFLEREVIKKIVDTIEYKKNIILQGPPGVGKTFMAKRLAYLVMEEMDKSKIEMVQFHQSYSYEDFIQGYRPKEDGTFKLENGVFYRFCKRAQADPGGKYFFIIDEINRGNLSKIFGELMLLIEADKRGDDHGVSLTYTFANETRFYIPTNLYLIGTMNTADRSLAMVDYALRRRFAFIDVTPTFNQKFKNELINLGVDEAIIDRVVNKIFSLNQEIEKDTNLRKGFQVGHSYFCNVPKGSGDIDWYHGIINHEIAPLLKEYWFDNEQKADLEISRLYLQ